MRRALVLAAVAAGLATTAAAQNPSAPRPGAQSSGAQNPEARDSLGAGADRQLARRKSWEPTPPPSDPRDFTGIWEVPNPKIDLKNDEGKDPPFTPDEAKSTQRMIDAEKAGAVITDASTQCFPHGVPRLTFAPYPIRFVHQPGKILMLHEVGHNVRVIYMDKTEAPKDTPMSFLGYSVGRWEGNTLVVEATHLNGQTRLDMHTSHGPRLKVTERWTKEKTAQGFTDLVDVITVDDPDHFTKTFSVTRHFAYRGDLEANEGADGVTEYSCEENNRNVPSADGVVTTEVRAAR
ncbi:MAG: hypothetical protein ACXU8Q_06750 [Caulobacteraceae bacterium]